MADPCPIRQGQILTRSRFNEPMRVETIRADGSDSWTVGLIGTKSERFRSVSQFGLDEVGDGMLMR